MSLLRSFLALFLICQSSAEVVTLVAANRGLNSGQPAFSSKSITLAAGETVTANYVSNEAFVDVTIGSILIRLDANNPDQTNLPVIAGPATVRLANFTSANAALATFTVKRAGNPAPVPGQVVVIPDDGSGDHEVSLESSKDMVNWVASSAGLFNSANSTRFFRVKVVKKSKP
jgi:hypothetical protein